MISMSVVVVLKLRLYACALAFSCNESSKYFNSWTCAALSTTFDVVVRTDTGLYALVSVGSKSLLFRIGVIFANFHFWINFPFLREKFIILLSGIARYLAAALDRDQINIVMPKSRGVRH